MSAEAYRWRCSCCGEELTGLPMDMAFQAPVDWEALDEATRAASQLNSDFCEVRYSNGKVDRFIRCLLPLPVPRISDEFCFGVWMSVSERSWDIYEAGFDSGSYSENGCFGYLMHNIPDMPDHSFCMQTSYSSPTERGRTSFCMKRTTLYLQRNATG